MATKAKEKAEEQDVEAEQQETAQSRSEGTDGPVVLHIRSIADVHYYTTLDTFNAAEAWASEFKADHPGQFDYDVNIITPLIDIQSANPPQPTEDEATPQSGEGPLTSAEPILPGIPDRATLRSMSRADLNHLAAQHGIEIADFDNNEDLAEALEDSRP